VFPGCVSRNLGIPRSENKRFTRKFYYIIKYNSIQEQTKCGVNLRIHLSNILPSIDVICEERKKKLFVLEVSNM
jgi:hypothetical protein